jgi:hypothetical protein
MKANPIFAKKCFFANQECRGEVLRLLKLRGLGAAMAVRPICKGAVLCHSGHLYPV